MIRTAIRLLLPIIALCAAPAMGQVPAWLWARSSAGPGIGVKSGKAVATDRSGNVYVAGSFSTSSVTFGPVTLSNSAAGNLDIFLVKYNASGTVIWAKSMGAESSESGEAVVCDSSGNVYLSGYFFSHSIAFGPYTLTSYGPVSGMLKSQEYLVKLDPSGNVLWAKSSSGTYGSEAGTTSLSIDAAGNIYEAGYFWSATLVLGSYMLTNAGPPDITNDIFLAKYDPSGNVLWASSAGGGLKDICYAVAADASGSVYVTGKSESPTLSFGSTSLTNSGGYDAFLARYDDASGGLSWAKNIGGTGIDIGRSIAGDGLGNVYVTGYSFSPVLSFGTTTLTNPDPSTSKLFLSKYDAAGNLDWASTTPGRATGGQGVSVRSSGGICLVGYFSDTITLGASTFITSYNVNNIGYYHLFAAACDTNGTVQWAKDAGSFGDALAAGATLDLSDNLYVTGSFSSPTISFGAYTVTNTTAGNSGEAFVSKLRTGSAAGIDVDQPGIEGGMVYPNPVGDMLHISLPGSSPATVAVHNVAGRSVIPPTVFQPGNADISTADLLPGIYILTITNTELKTETIRFIK